MLHIKKIIIPLLIVALIVNFIMLFRLNAKVDGIISDQFMMHSKIMSNESSIKDLQSLIELEAKSFVMNGISVTDSYLMSDENAIKLNFSVDFNKLPSNHTIKIELSSTKDYLENCYDPFNADYKDKEWISLSGDNNIYSGELKLQLDRNYQLSVIVNDGVEQTKEYIGYVSAKEWAYRPINVSIMFRELGIQAPNKGYYRYDLNFYNETSSDSYVPMNQFSDFYNFDNIRLFDFSEIKSLRYNVSYKGDIVGDFALDLDTLKKNSFTMPGEVNFTCPIDTNYSDGDFEFTIFIELTSGKTLEIKPYKMY